MLEQKTSPRRYNRLKLNFNREHTPHPHQAEAFDAWQSHQYRGVVVLPTGSGKSLLALMGIAEIGRSTLVVAPTIDLMNQWYGLAQRRLFLRYRHPGWGLS